MILLAGVLPQHIPDGFNSDKWLCQIQRACAKFLIRGPTYKWHSHDKNPPGYAIGLISHSPVLVSREPEVARDQVTRPVIRRKKGRKL